MLDEVRWTVFSDHPGPIFARWNWGGRIRTKLRMGRIALTGTRDGGNFVPLWNFCAPPNGSAIAVEQESSVLGVIQAVSHYVWKLPKPLIVPRGSVLSSEFFRPIDTLPFVATVSVAYSGIYLPPTYKMTAEMAVPYVTLFEPAGATASSAFLSSELDLVNPFLVPLHVQRFIGRIEDGVPPSQMFEVVSPSVPTVTMKDSWGNNVVRDFTAFATVFDSLRRAWTFGKVLNPKERYMVSLLNVTTALPVPVPRPMISMVGWRNEVFR